MTQHTDLIERLTDEAYEWSRYVTEDRAPSTLSDYLEPHIKAVANALEAQAAEIERLRKYAERYKFLRKCHWTDSPPTYVVTTLEGLKLNAMTYSDDRLDEVLDARVAANSTATQKGQP